MNAEQYLKQIERLNGRIDADIERLSRLRHGESGVSGIRYDTEQVQTSPTSDGLFLTVAEIIEMEERIDSGIDALAALKEQISQEIFALGDLRNAEMLYLRYVKLWPLEKISKQIGMSYRQTLRRHRQALKEFECSCPVLEKML